MNQFEIKENIASLLESILERSVQINHGANASVLEVDVLMDDLRSLYREYEALRGIYSSQQARHEVKPPAAEAPESTLDEADEVTPATVPPAAHTPQQEAAEPLAMEREPRAQQQQPESPQEEPGQHPEAAQQPAPANDPQEAEPIDEDPAHHQSPKAVEPQAEEPQAPVDPPKEAETTHEPQKPTQHQESEPPAAPPRTPVAPPEEPAARPAGPRSIIDLFSEPVEKSIGDHFKKEDDSLHQRISQNKADFSIGTRMQQSPVADIRAAIGVNEKFLFINELFHGNIQSYNDAIARLNSFQNVQPAFEYLNELASTYSWDEKRSAETIEKLANIVQRRYMKS